MAGININILLFIVRKMPYFYILPGWFNVVKAAETLGLIGLVLSLLLSASLLFHKQTRGAKIINIFFVGMSGNFFITCKIAVVHLA